MLRVPCPVLVGRADEVAGVLGAMEEARAGRGSLVVLSGESGIGKSRLADELSSQGAGAGGSILRGRARPRSAEGYQPIREALLSFSRIAELPHSSELGPYRTVLGGLIPPWAGPTYIDTSSTLLLGEGLLRLLRMIAGDEFVVLILEDLHSADLDTLVVTEYLAEHVKTEPVLVLATMCPGMTAAGDEWLGELASSRVASVRRLTPLAPREVADLAAACLGIHELPGGIGELIARRTGGVPLLIEELVRTIAEDGGFDDAGWLSPDFDLDAVAPATLASDVSRRVDSLSDQGCRLVHGVAAVGETVPHDLAHALAELTAREGAAARRESVKAGLLVEEPGGIRVRHALVGEAIRRRLPATERRELARVIIGEPDRQPDGEEAPRPTLPHDVLARLHEEAGDATGAARLLLELGQHELARGSLAMAENVLRRARSLRPDPATAERTDEALLGVLCQAGRIDDAVALVESMPDDAGAGDMHTIQLALAEALVSGGRFDEGETLLSEVADRVAPHGATAASADTVRARLAMARGDVDVAVQIAQHTLDDLAPDAKTRCQALLLLGRAARASDLERARSLFEQASKASLEAASAALSIEATHELATVAMVDTGSVDLLLEVRQSAFDAAALRTSAEIDVQLAGVCALRFEPDRSLLHALRATDTAERLRLPVLHALALVRQGSAHAVAGRRPAMEVALDEALRRQPDHVDIQALASQYRAICSLLEDDADDAAAELQAACDSAEESLGTSASPMRSLLTLLDVTRRTAAYTPPPPTPVPLLQALDGYAHAVHLGTTDAGAAARVFLAADDLLEARPAFAGMRHLARQLVAPAAIEHQWGEPERWLRSAAAYFDDRHPAVAASCRRTLRDAGLPVPRRGRGSGPVPLALLELGVTSRECDVLALVREGLSNPEIGAQLYLSTRTVEKHLEQLRRKTGAASRAELADAADQFDVLKLRTRRP